MKYFILIFTILLASFVPAFASINYSAAPPVEKTSKKKKKHRKKKLRKKRKGPNQEESKGKVVWLIIGGCFWATLSLAALIIGVVMYVFSGVLNLWFILLGLFLGGSAILCFILASVYSKNRGVREKKGRGRNEGKATY